MSNTSSVLPENMTEITIDQPGGPEVLIPRRVPVPRPAAGEVLVKVEAAGVNRPDVIQRQGHYPMPEGVNPTPGLEIAGRVAALGEGVTGVGVGEAICGLTNGGGYAEYCLVPSGQVLQLPAGLDMITASAIPETFFTVWANLFQIGGAKEGQIVLVHGGSSGIGTTALALCREFGIRAFATAGSEEKCAAIAALGAEAVNYRTQDFAEVVTRRTGGHGADVVLDIMGASYFDRNMAALARDGRLVVIGFLGGTTTARFDLQQLALKRAIVTGSTMRGRTSEEKAGIATELREKVWPILAAGRCLPIIHAVFPLLEAADAHRLMEGGSHVGKIVLKVANVQGE
ncbi:NAD(P)H-quinone oxidoreductase [Bradyrhizobium sp. NAS80.1]|uniref:NAD(P)H-quinone oxidoreductase n=1 Tax=Bradyrhizobium sp. NAS80.1 TaxID=1680159 RepID=UPI00095F34E4|nr:NAD(P)H-quinone oxidoreductase [Bradyrhizobium sp. NAS80.1]OKO82290.1 NAD(P)H-quinone oxidoreductase [Bradyrhizobium sp. NAS80.1]